jgi:hypothetical protein
MYSLAIQEGNITNYSQQIETLNGSEFIPAILLILLVTLFRLVDQVELSSLNPQEFIKAK